VAFPTETVYGLGADATNAAAVRKIFAVKGRPSTNPLICHVPDAAVAQRYAREWRPAASRLSDAFWPGPLTLVLPKTNDIPHEVTAGRDTVALRAPNHPLALVLLRVLDRPLAGPSANRSSHISPTTAQHVRDELGAEVDMILDGGPCDVGIESTVLDLSGARAAILRPGGVTREQIEAVIGPVDVFAGAVDAAVAAASPGQQEKHYAPRTLAYRFEAVERARVSGAILELTADTTAYARQFYARLRELDQSGATAIYIEMPPDAPQWTAVRDRIVRATQPLPPP
jgi:L-threonylcarbamoyladenylate synthase